MAELTYRLEERVSQSALWLNGLVDGGDVPVTNLKGMVTRSSSSDILAVISWGWKCCGGGDGGGGGGVELSLVAIVVGLYRCRLTLLQQAQMVK